MTLGYFGFWVFFEICIHFSRKKIKLNFFKKIENITLFFYTLLGQDCLLDHDHARKS